MIVAVVFIAACAAFLVSAVAGGGAGLVLVPLLRLIVPIGSVPAALSIGTAASSLSRIAIFRASIRWDVVRRFVPTALPGAALGAWLLSRMEPAYVELILALFLIANLPALLRRRESERSVRPLSMARLPMIGVAAGVLSGFTGAVGLVFNGAYQRLGMTRHEIVATRATNEILLHLLKIAIYAALGLIGQTAIVAGALVAAAAILASVTTRWVLPRIDEGLFRRIGQGAMVASGVAMFVLSGTQIAALHRAWIAAVDPGGERELQFYWNGRQQIAVEAEPEGYLVFERSIAFESMPEPLRRRALRHVPRGDIHLVEEVRSHKGLGYEIYYLRGRRLEKIELS